MSVDQISKGPAAVYLHNPEKPRNIYQHPQEHHASFTDLTNMTVYVIGPSFLLMLSLRISQLKSSHIKPNPMKQLSGR